MQKINSILKTIVAVVIVLVMAQGCGTENIAPPATIDLQGKVKNMIFTLDSINNFAKFIYNFNYDDSGKLLNFRFNAVSLYANINYNVVYQTNKLSVLDSTESGYIYYLQAGTNLIDSIAVIYQNRALAITNIKRNATGNLIEIVENQIRWYDFEYENGNLVSYNLEFTNTIGVSFSHTKYILNYDTHVLKDIGTNPYPILEIIPRYSGVFLLLDYDVLGLSMGNTSRYQLSSIIWKEDAFDHSPERNDTLQYNYNETKNVIYNSISGKLAYRFFDYIELATTYY